MSTICVGALPSGMDWLCWDVANSRAPLVFSHPLLSAGAIRRTGVRGADHKGARKRS